MAAKQRPWQTNQQASQPLTLTTPPEAGKPRQSSNSYKIKTAAKIIQQDKKSRQNKSSLHVFPATLTSCATPIFSKQPAIYVTHITARGDPVNPATHASHSFDPRSDCYAQPHADNVTSSRLHCCSASSRPAHLFSSTKSCVYVTASLLPAQLTAGDTS